MRDKQQKSQAELAFMSSAEVKPTARLAEGTETLAAGSRPESQAGNGRLRAGKLHRENLKAAKERGGEDKGAGAGDGRRGAELRPHPRQHRPEPRQQRRS